MQKRKWQWMFLALVIVAGITFAGCKKAAKPAEQAAPAAPPAAAENKPAEAAAPAAPAAQEYTFEALCKKVVAESKAASGAAFSAQIEKQTLDGCMAAAKAYEKVPKADAAMGAYAKAILTACEGKAAQEWVKCYAAEAQNAGKAASDAMMK